MIVYQLAVQCKAQRCYESQSRQLKNEGENFSALCAERSALCASMHCLPQWQWHYKIALYRSAHYVMQTILVVMHAVSSEVQGSPKDFLG